jgi:hypothetical protein
MASKEKKVEIFERIEDEALAILEKFKENPIRSIVTAFIILWFVKTIVAWIKER